MKYDKIGVNVLRGLSLDMIAKAKSGHPGIVLSASPLVYTLFTRHLVSDPTDPTWINRDRFVLSCGHASAMMYSLLHLCGYPLPMDQLKLFRQLSSLTPGHPEYGHTPGIDATAGPLGQGISQAVGMAMAEAHLPTLFKDGQKLINHYTYVLCGDGCLEEGISQEAISIAGVLRLNKLILMYDRNDCTLDGPLSNSSVEDVKERFLASKWNVLEVQDGNNIDEIDNALQLAKRASEKPTIIICHTVIGYGSELSGRHESHGKAFSSEEVVKTKENLGVPFPAFEVPEEAYLAFKESFIERGTTAHRKYEEETKLYQIENPAEFKKFSSFITNDITPYLFNDAPKYAPDYKEATRNVSQSFLNLLSGSVENLFGGSADVAESVKTHVKTFSDFSFDNRRGENINFGIREFAMAGIQNGILLHGGLRTYIGSFLVFADYMKAAIRMSAMEKIPAVYLFSHDSVAVGEDGPTHQPIEHLTMLRTIPGVCVYRPADAIETAASYRAAFESTDTPTCIILSRQALFNNPSSSYEGALKGGYIASPEKEKAVLTILASGSEVNTAVLAQKILLANGIDVRVVSMPSFERFDAQSQEYKDSVIGNPYEQRVFVEMGKTDCLYKYAAHVIGIDRFGYSAPANDVIAKLGFTPADIAEKIRSLIK
ncbi:MAG: transketolase [Bacilli bacterium]